MKLVRGLAWRGSMRPAYVPSAAWRQRPIGVLSHRYRGPHEGAWSWTCRLDCWAELTSGWYLATREQALEEGLEHLRLFHYPEPCLDPNVCTESHVFWVHERATGSVSVASHLRNWQPVVPLLHDQVTLRA